MTGDKEGDPRSGGLLTHAFDGQEQLYILRYRPEHAGFFHLVIRQMQGGMPFEAATIAAGLADLNTPPAVELHRICESTNVIAGRGQGSSLCLAEIQTAGRGRRGRAWVQPFASGLALSYGLPLRVARVDGLAIAMAVAVVEGLAACGFSGIGLKWPNDVYACGAKLGGVMVEIAGGREPRLVVGVGVNVHVAPALDGRATVALVALASLPSRNVLAIEIARALVFALLEFERAGF